jgi:3-oxoacyl-(acyl-carrier-protein) synthase
MNLYIKGLGCISPQNTFGDVTFMENAVIPEGEYFTCVEPPYREYIDPKISRRMSRIIKMGIASAKMALADGGITEPGAIITGTGLGCVADTGQFLDDIISSNEGMCSPTAFIQSTHNTISSQIAINLTCHSYNSTYVQRAHSFESALLDASLRISDGCMENALVGGVDELTPRLADIAKKMGLSRSLHDSDAVKGFVPGEGSVFALVSADASGKNYAKIRALRFAANVSGHDAVRALCGEALREANLSADAVDCVIDGNSSAAEGEFDSIIKSGFPGAARVSYKNYCGEYFTASAFGLWLGARIVSRGSLPSHFNQGGRAVANTLIYNRAGDSYHSFIILSHD